MQNPLHLLTCALVATLLSACAVTPKSPPAEPPAKPEEVSAPATDWLGIARQFEAALPPTTRVEVDAAGGLRLVIPAAAGFETGKADLRPALRDSLDATVAPLQTNPDLQAHIVGHTDSIGREGYNMILSRHRAKAVRQHLMDKGIEPQRLSAEGRGEMDPVADNDTAEGRSQNRRVEIRLFLPK